MSLYSREEICLGCSKAVFHDCCGSFCKCKDGLDEGINAYHGTCEFKDLPDVCPHCGSRLLIKNYGKCSKCDL